MMDSNLSEVWVNTDATLSWRSEMDPSMNDAL